MGAVNSIQLKRLPGLALSFVWLFCGIQSLSAGQLSPERIWNDKKPSWKGMAFDGTPAIQIFCGGFELADQTIVHVYLEHCIDYDPYTNTARSKFLVPRFVTWLAGKNEKCIWCAPSGEENELSPRTVPDNASYFVRGNVVCSATGWQYMYDCGQLQHIQSPSGESIRAKAHAGLVTELSCDVNGYTKTLVRIVYRDDGQPSHIRAFGFSMRATYECDKLTTLYVENDRGESKWQFAYENDLVVKVIPPNGNPTAYTWTYVEPSTMDVYSQQFLCPIRLASIDNHRYRAKLEKFGVVFSVDGDGSASTLIWNPQTGTTARKDD